MPQNSWEFLVVDNASSDITPWLLEQQNWPSAWQVRIVREDKLGVAHARNRAVQEAQGEYLIFLDDDETPDADWLVTYEFLIQERRPDAFGGRIEVMFESERPPWLTDELLGFLGHLDYGSQPLPLTALNTPCYTGNFGFRLSTCQAVGVFDTQLGRRGNANNGGEDVDFYRRLVVSGFTVWWAPEALIYHRIQATKIKRSYFLDLHYRQGRMEAIRRRGSGSRIPPKYLYGQLLRAVGAVWRDFRAGGRNATLRKEMNVAYFVGYLSGWMRGVSAP